MNVKQNQDKEYMSMINYLISNLSKAKVSPSSILSKPEVTPMFLFEFFIFELYLPRDLIKIVKQPIIACRLFDFPTLTFEGKVNLQKERILFNTGKRSFFEMDLAKLKDNLINQPMYIMFLDLNHGNMKIIGNCRLNISVFAYDNFLNFDINSEGPDPRRNILQLFDNSMEKVGEFEISLLIRREYHKYDKNIEFENNKKAALIKKLKKNREKYKKETNEQLFFKGEEKPKVENLEIMNNFYENNIQKEQTQPQFINNFILKGKDNAFNAHPVNKVIVIKPQSQSNNQSQTENENQSKKKKKKKKKKISKKSVDTETDLLPGVKVPINNINYSKGKSQNKNNKNNLDNGGAQNSYSNSMYNNKNNQQLIQSMYNKFQNNPQSNNNSNSFHYNNSNNNFFNTNNSNFNNNINSNRNNNKNIDDNLLFYQTNGMNPNANIDNQNSNISNNSNNNISYSKNLNETNKSNSNEYLKLVLELKSKVNSYKDKIINEQKNIQKLKEERNINNNLDNLDINNKNENENMQNEINDKNNIQEDNDSKDEPNQNENDNLNENNEFNKNDKNEFNKKDDNGLDKNIVNNNNNDNKDNNDEIGSKKYDDIEAKGDDNNNYDNNNGNNNIKENNNNKFNNIQLNSDYFEDNNNSNSNNNINNNINANKFNNIDNKIINEDENIGKEYESDLVQNIDESQSNVLPNKGSSDNFVSSSLGQYFQKEEKKPGYNDKQNIIESTIKEEFNESNISDRKDININAPSEKSSLNKIQNPKENQNKVDESEIPEESIIKRTNNANANNINQEYKAPQTVISENKSSSNNESEIKEEPSLINKFNHYNYEINSGMNEIQENIEGDSFNRNQKEKYNIASQSEIKEDTSLMKNYNMDKNGNNEMPNVKISSRRNSSSKSNQDRKGSYAIKSYNTDEIEEEIIED